jgi:hypothetical protein
MEWDHHQLAVDGITKGVLAFILKGVDTWEDSLGK